MLSSSFLFEEAKLLIKDIIHVRLDTASGTTSGDQLVMSSSEYDYKKFWEIRNKSIIVTIFLVVILLNFFSSLKHSKISQVSRESKLAFNLRECKLIRRNLKNLETMR